MKRPYLISAGLLALTLTSAHAATGISTEIGTTGLGLHLTTPLMTDVNGRVGINLLNYSYSSSTSNVDYDLKLKLKSFDALLDWFPMHGGFHVTGGVVVNGNRFDAHGKSTATGTYTINGHTYTSASAGTVDGKIDFNSVAPYLGIGWGNAAATTGWGIVSDLGVMFQGSPRSALANNNCQADAATCQQLAVDVASENTRLQDKVRHFDMYPVVRIGVRYTF